MPTAVATAEAAPVASALDSDVAKYAVLTAVSERPISARSLRTDRSSPNVVNRELVAERGVGTALLDDRQNAITAGLAEGTFAAVSSEYIACKCGRRIEGQMSAGALLVVSRTYRRMVSA
jgi:hypothetical protein